MPRFVLGLNPLRAALVALAGLAGASARGEELDSVMYSQPEIRVARVVNKYPDGLADLWLEALERPERETRARAALAIAQAHEEGMPDLAATAPALLKLLDKPDEHPAVLAAAARALVALDVRAAAPAFLKLAKSGNPDLRDLVEPALARWGHQPAYELWLARIGQAPPHRHEFLLAVRCLGVVREGRAAPRLRDLALSPDATPAVRLAAARALAEIRTSGSEADAAKLGGDRTPAGRTSRLVAASLLRHHQGDETVRLLKALAADAGPAVALAALTRLSELGTQHVLPVLDPVVASEGAEVRMHGVAAMVRHPSDEHVRRLAGVLHDPHPDVRVAARKGLRELAAERRALVIDLASGVLNDRDWRGQEQAAILLAQLDHKPAAGRMVALLTTNRSEVAVAVGWGLRKLAVPETLPAALAHVKARHAALLAPPRKGVPEGLTADALDGQLSQLVQFMGQAGYREADGEMRALVPRILRDGFPPDFTPVGPEVRTAAIWVLGLFHEGKPDEALVSLVEGRLTGDGILGPDHPHVRAMAAITLGRLGAKQSLPALRERSGSGWATTDPVANACRWSVARLTGEALPAAGVVEHTRRAWFLAPLR
jgi:HEAT repeat protein